MEVQFYTQLGPRLVSLCPAVADFLPTVYAASHEEGKEYLILQDLIAAGFHTPAKTKTLRLNQPFLLHFISDGGMIFVVFRFLLL